MSLTPQQMQNTKQEFQQNLELSRLTIEQIASELQTSPEKIECILRLQQKSIEDPWILKGFLEQYIVKSGKKPVEFSALQGDYHQYWFLRTKKIDNMQLSKGNR
ncbi:DUF2316 family protein [Listeria rocourtiae]|uniref:DUF2316 family protein n=1 Tax=Listeria rocourtiae TaxID=647910 RepID=UPI003D2F8F41